MTARQCADAKIPPPYFSIRYGGVRGPGTGAIDLSPSLSPLLLHYCVVVAVVVVVLFCARSSCCHWYVSHGLFGSALAVVAWCVRRRADREFGPQALRW
jgi:hypothetical protein